jgi:hypothetical protein
MKTNPFSTLTAGLAALLIAPASGIEAPADDSPPPPAADAPADSRPPAPDAAKPAIKAQTPFLGVVSTEVPEMLAAHLGLKAGEGIIVQGLMPDGPAAKAGVAVHDVITRVANQPVASSEDLTRHVVAHKSGEKIHLNLIHQGKPVEIDVILGTRPDSMAMMPPRPLDQLHFDGIPQNLADRIRSLIEENLGGLKIQPGEDDLDIAPLPHMKNTMRDLKLRMDKAMEELKVPDQHGLPGIDVRQGATIRLMDEQGSVELKSYDGGKEVTVRDKDNKIIWTGPWDTDQDKAAAPQDVRQRVDRLHLNTKFKGKGLRLQLRGQPMPDE